MGDRVGVELLYNAVKTEVGQLAVAEAVGRDEPVELASGSSWVRVPVETSCGRESHTRPKGPGSLMSWGPEKMLIRCNKESHHPAEWASRPPVEHQENKKDTTCRSKKHTNFSNPCSKVRGKYFVKEVFLRPLLLRLFRSSVYYCWCRYDAAWTCICVYKYIYYASI